MCRTTPARSTHAIHRRPVSRATCAATAGTSATAATSAHSPALSGEARNAVANGRQVRNRRLADDDERDRDRQEAVGGEPIDRHGQAAIGVRADRLTRRQGR